MYVKSSVFLCIEICSGLFGWLSDVQKLAINLLLLQAILSIRSLCSKFAILGLIIRYTDVTASVQAVR